ncbi:MAG: BMP family ABC transporter substrate-binding protein [bacterium]
MSKRNRIGSGICALACLLLPCCGKESSVRSFRVTLVCDIAGLGDKGFNDAGWAGCQMAEQKIPGLELKVIQSKEQTDYLPNLNLAAEKSDAVVALGFLVIDAVKEAAARHPNVPFIFVDGIIQADNIASIDFKSEEAALLAGILAACVTKSGKVAVMPGMDIPPVEAFGSGYRAGVLCANRTLGKNVEVFSKTIGSFNNPVKAKSLAKGLFDEDVDIIFQLAGHSGLGVLEAVKEAPEGRYMIGVDIDQDDLAPGLVLTSVLKRMDLMVYREIKKVHEGTFTGGEYFVGVAEEAMGLTEMRHTKDLVPNYAFDIMERARKAIISGKLKPPRTKEDLETFEPFDLSP